MITSAQGPAQRPLQAVLAVAVLALAAGAAQVAQAMPGGHGGHGAHGMAGGHGAFGGGMLTERALDSVNATADQRSRIQAIFKAAREDMAKQHDARRSLRDQAMALFTQPTLDARAAEALRQQQLAQHDAASKRMLQALLDAAAVLSPEQRRQLADRMAQRRSMMERHRSERDTLERPSR
jgi:Spy/CpxP family protein refolding chaperone